MLQKIGTNEFLDIFQSVGEEGTVNNRGAVWLWAKAFYL